MVKTADSYKLKVAEAVQDDVNKGVVRVDSDILHQLGLKQGDIVEIKGEKATVCIVERAYPGDIGLKIIRMDGLTRRNARTGIGEYVEIKKAEVLEAKKVIIAPAHQGISVKAPSEVFRQGLLGRPVVKGDLVSLGGTRRRRSNLTDSPFLSDIFNIMNESFQGFGFAGDLKFQVVDVLPKGSPVIITESSTVEFNPEAVEISEETATKVDVSYEDIGGLDDEIKKIREMVELPLKHPEVFAQLGIEPPKGVLLYGPPGTGKTLLARAIANETNSNFTVINGPEIMSKFYGESEANLRKVFEDAEKNAPSIIFFDEIDAIATNREESKGEVERRVVAQLLSIMDGLKSRGKVVVIAATNMPNALDPALRRPGRFDREIEINPPSKAGRLSIIKIHTRSMPLEGTFYPDLAGSELLLKKDKLLEQIPKKIKVNEIKISDSEHELASIKKDIAEMQEEVAILERKRKTTDESAAGRIFNMLTQAKNKIERKKEQLETKNAEILALKKEISTSGSIKEKLTLILDKFQNTILLEEVVSALKETENYIIEQQAKGVWTLNDERIKLIQNVNKNKSAKVKAFINELVEAEVIDDSFYSDIKSKGIQRDLDQIATVTHGFVGADLAALSRETAMCVVRKVLPAIDLEDEKEIPQDILKKLVVRMEDFRFALKTVRPSALREVLIEVPKVKWTDIGGLDEVKQQLKEAVEWPLTNPEAFIRMGIRPPRGILLYGPPGTGKTMMAKAIATESEANFISIKGPELLSKWVGESEKAVRKIFEKARQVYPCIIFFDEIDSLVPRRGGENEGNHAIDSVVNQLLTEIDGVEEMNDVIIIGATNRPDRLDPALLRPGRFDRLLLIPGPDDKSREQIIKIHAKGIPCAENVNFEEISKKLVGYAGADIESVCREAAIRTLRRYNEKDKELKQKLDSEKVSQEEYAKQKQVLDNMKVTKADFEDAMKEVRPSITPEIDAAYADLQNKFSSAKGTQMVKEKVNYFG